MSTPVDLRSDTMTRPSPAMRAAMAAAEVGDDVWGEDPTVIELEKRTAALLGKEAGLFVPSGTMANQLAVLVHTQRGDEVLGGWGSHVNNYEAGAAAALGGVLFTELGSTGLYSADDITTHVRPDDIHAPRTRLVWLENTHNRGGGRVFPQDEVLRIAERARRHGLSMHLDGARLMHAAVASGRTAAELVAPVDSTSICLSKGLGCPVGSVLGGSGAFIEGARRWRKRLGGGMRQVGILAAAGLYALEQNVERLADDHRRARRFAEGIADLPTVELDLQTVETNLVIFSLQGGAAAVDGLLARCQQSGVRLCPFGTGRVRAVFHLDIDEAGCDRAIEAVRTALAHP